LEPRARDGFCRSKLWEGCLDAYWRELSIVLTELGPAVTLWSFGRDNFFGFRPRTKQTMLIMLTELGLVLKIEEKISSSSEVGRDKMAPRQAFRGRSTKAS